jgi:hypothetical protein
MIVESSEYDLNEYQDVTKPAATKTKGLTAALKSPKKGKSHSMQEVLMSEEILNTIAPDEILSEPAIDEPISSDQKELNTMSSKNNPPSYTSVMDKPMETDLQDFEATLEFPSNVKTLVGLVADLPEGVTKQTGAQIIRLTMEAMGISMETVLSEAQSTQSELLDSARVNLKKIEEYRTVIRKLESEIRFQQNKANELSEIIDLFILSNTSSKMPNLDNLDS